MNLTPWRRPQPLDESQQIDTTIKDLVEKLTQGQLTQELLVERLAELELALDDEGWTKLATDRSREFSRDGLRKIAALSRMMYLKNPLVERAVNVKAYYVWSQGVNVQAREPIVNEVVQAFLDDQRNRAEFTSHQARVLKEVDLQVLGNLFLVYFTDALTGRVTVRSLPVDEVSDIITNPDDAKEHWFYKREWTVRTVDNRQERRVALYPHWKYNPGNRPESIAGIKVEWGAAVQHVRVGGLSDMRFGIPETYSMMDWARAYKNALEDDATRSRALARYAWNLTTTGGKQAVDRAKAKLETTVGTTAPNVERNPPSTAGATFISGDDRTKMDPMRLAGTMLPSDHARPMRLMTAAGAGLPETFFGDADVGNHATSKTLDRPTELMMLDRQTLWHDVIEDMLNFVVRQAALAPSGALRGKVRIPVEPDPGDVSDVPAVEADGLDTTIDIVFPSILEHDVKETVDAIVTAATLAGNERSKTMDDITLSRMLLTALGISDVDDLLDEMFPDGERNLPEPEDDEDEPSTDERVVEVLRKLTEAITSR